MHSSLSALTNRAQSGSKRLTSDGNYAKLSPV